MPDVSRQPNRPLRPMAPERCHRGRTGPDGRRAAWGGGVSRLTVLVQPPGAPGCVVLLPEGADYNLGDGDGSVLLQHDMDQVATAYMLGPGLCRCGGSDGTVGCECATAEEHYEHGIAWLWDQDGESFEDPGYLDG